MLLENSSSGSLVASFEKDLVLAKTSFGFACDAADLFSVGFSLMDLDLLGTLSFRPRGRPVFLATLGLRFRSSASVSSCHVRPFQMSRMVFSLISYFLATEVAVGFLLIGDWIIESRKISIA